jgi:hypothetical protein
MKRSTKRLLTSLVLLIALACAPMSAMAETVSITAGSLAYTPSTVTFSGTALDNATTQTATGSSTINVTDNRGSGAGWSVTLAVTDLTSTAITDITSSGGTGTYTVKIPASAVSVAGGAFATTAGQTVDPTYGPLTYSKVLSTSAQSVANATPGFGAGVYNSTLNFTLTFPHTVTVVSQTGTGSKFIVGSTVGLPASIFTSTFTYTSSAGV